MTINFAFSNILTYMLVFVRLAGMLLFNPLLSRNNVPPRVRLGLVLFMALILAPLQPQSTAAAVYDLNMYMYLFTVLRELAIGLVFGYIFQIFYYLLFFAGDLIDTDIGISMAKVMDPSTSIQAGFTSWIVTIMFVLYLFATGAHLTLLHIFADTFNTIQVGTFKFNVSIVEFVLHLFTRAFSLVVRVAAPFMVAEVIMQMCMGILMKFIPQITVFVINFQMRIILGIIMLYLLAPFIGQFVDRYIDTLFDNLVDASAMMAQMSAA